MALLVGKQTGAVLTSVTIKCTSNEFTKVTLELILPTFGSLPDLDLPKSFNGMIDLDKVFQTQKVREAVKDEVDRQVRAFSFE